MGLMMWFMVRREPHAPDAALPPGEIHALREELTALRAERAQQTRREERSAERSPSVPTSSSVRPTRRAAGRSLTPKRPRTATSPRLKVTPTAVTAS